MFFCADPWNRADCVNGQCSCMANAEGGDCDRCRQGTFGLGTSAELGCQVREHARWKSPKKERKNTFFDMQDCWCSGVAGDCSEAQLFWSTLRFSPSGEEHGVKVTDRLAEKKGILDLPISFKNTFF